MKYINADDLLSVLKDIHPLDYNGMALKSQIINLPSANVEKVVKCKECTFYKPHKIINNIEINVCANPFGLSLACNDDFCSRGNPKDDL